MSIFAMWAVMMAAMMLPGAAPAIARHARARGIAAALFFTAGYLAVWTGFSLAATLAQYALDSAQLLSDEMALASPLAAGLAVVAIGLYQLTPLKHSCLRRCGVPAQEQSPRASALVQGIRYGISCLGCCWALMGILFVVGLMNLFWIAAIALWVVAEKALPWGRHLARLAGAGLIAWGSVAIAAAVV